MRIVGACESNCCYFSCRRNAAGIIGFYAYQKIAGVRVIAYGIPVDYTNEYLQIGKDTTLKCVWMFVHTLNHLFGDEYLQATNEEDTKRLTTTNEARGWPDMLGSIMHWRWNNFPTAWHGRFT
jgi:hypothetical protein